MRALAGYSVTETSWSSLQDAWRWASTSFDAPDAGKNTLSGVHGSKENEPTVTNKGNTSRYTVEGENAPKALSWLEFSANQATSQPYISS
jgi:hypothetical protein